MDNGIIKTTQPEVVKEFFDTKIGTGGFGTCSEYLRESLRNEQDRLQLRGLLLTGAQSMPSMPVDANYFNALYKRINSKVLE